MIKSKLKHAKIAKKNLQYFQRGLENLKDLKINVISAHAFALLNMEIKKLNANFAKVNSSSSSVQRESTVKWLAIPSQEIYPYPMEDYIIGSKEKKEYQKNVSTVEHKKERLNGQIKVININKN